MTNLEQFAKDIESHEGRCRHMYLDNRGFVTCGVGFLLKSAATSVFMPWWNIAMNDFAMPIEVERDFHRVAAMPKDHHASYYRGIPAIELTDKFITAHLNNIIVNGYVHGIKQKCPKFDSFPLPAQRALVDLCYGLGVVGFGKFGNLISCCNAGDWKDAALESHVSSRRPERNKWVKNLFEETGK